MKKCYLCALERKTKKVNYKGMPKLICKGCRRNQRLGEYHWSAR